MRCGCRARQVESEKRPRGPDRERDQRVQLDAPGLEQRDADGRHDDARRGEREAEIADGAPAPVGRSQLPDQNDRHDDRHAHAQPTRGGGGEHQPRVSVRKHVSEARQCGHQLARDEQPGG